jgi:quercetin dioxygenase-like cupin family protein
MGECCSLPVIVSRRVLFETVFSAGTATLFSGLRLVAHANAADVRQVFEHALPATPLNNWIVTVIEVDYPPGSASEPHRHPGFVLGYVLEGQVRFQLEGQAETTYRAGEMFYEPPGSVHLVSANASAEHQARLLAMVFAPKGSTLSLPA